MTMPLQNSTYYADFYTNLPAGYLNTIEHLSYTTILGLAPETVFTGIRHFPGCTTAAEDETVQDLHALYSRMLGKLHLQRQQDDLADSSISI